MYAPIATLVVLSFNAQQNPGKMGRLYNEMVHSAVFQLRNHAGTLQHAPDCAVICCFCNADRHHCCAMPFSGMKKESRAVLMSITNIPMLNAEIVTGISLMLLFLTL